MHGFNANRKQFRPAPNARPGSYFVIRAPPVWTLETGPHPLAFNYIGDDSPMLRRQDTPSQCLQCQGFRMLQAVEVNHTGVLVVLERCFGAIADPPTHRG